MIIKSRKKIAAALMTAVLLMAGCGSNDELTAVKDTYVPGQTGESVTESMIENGEIEFKDNDYYSDYDSTAIVISFDGDSVKTDGKESTVKDGVYTISAAGDYVLSGKLEGRIEISAGEKDKIHLWLDGLTIEASNGPCIYEETADKVIISLVEGRENDMSDSENYDSAFDEVTACLYFEDSLTINGSGNLTVTAVHNDGITSKGNLKIMEGSLRVEAEGDALVAKKKLIARDGEVSLKAGKHGLKASDEEKGTIYLLGGTVNINSDKDAINSALDIYINGGNIVCFAGDDGIHADNMLTVNGGTIVISESNEGVEGIYIFINDGNLIINAEDDGMNASTGNGGDSFPEGNFPRGQGGFGGGRPDGFSGGGQPGELPEGFDGEFPEGFPEGEMPDFGSFQNGKMPDFGNMPDGVMPGNGDFSGGYNRKPESDQTRPDNTDMSYDKMSTKTNNSGDNDSTATPKITINGGSIKISAGGDGIDSNGSIEMNGGNVFVDGPEEDMNSAIDYDGTFIMNGGTLTAIGSSGMYQSLSGESRLYVIDYISDSSIAAGSEIVVKDGDKVLAEFTNSKKIRSVLFASEEIENGKEYTITVNGNATAVKAGEGGKYTGFGFGGGTNPPGMQGRGPR